MRKIIIFIISIFYISVFSQKVWSLQEMIEHAKNNNLQVITSNYSLAMEEKNIQIAKNEYKPSVSMSIGNGLRFGQTQGFQGGIGRNDNFSNDIGVSTNITLYNGNKVKKQIEQKQAEVNVAKYNLDATKNDIKLLIIEQYLNVLLNKEIFKTNQIAVENAQKLYDRAETTTKIGTTAKTILMEAKANLAREKQNLKSTEINIKRSLFTLSQTLLIDYNNFDVEDIYTEKELIKNHHNIEDVISKAYENQPKIKSAEYSIKSAESQTKIAKTGLYPMISFNAGIGSFYYNSLVTNTSGIDSFGNHIKEANIWEQYKTNFYQQIGLSINIPIFNKGNTKIQIEQAKINEEIAKNNLNIKKQEILQNIQKIYFDLDNYYETYLTSIETENSTKLALDFAEKSYAVGKTNIYDLNIARQNYFNAVSSTIQAKYNYIFNKKILETYLSEF